MAQVKKIPSFDPKQLPYWNIYEKEAKEDSILIGGTMAGEFTAGLSGGQRKILLFELIRSESATSPNFCSAWTSPLPV